MSSRMMRPQMENPEREASMHKYALEKMKEEYERFKLEVPHSLLRMRCQGMRYAAPQHVLRPCATLPGTEAGYCCTRSCGAYKRISPTALLPTRLPKLPS
eukprot:569292-Rhodomonas_salina.1